MAKKGITVTLGTKYKDQGGFTTGKVDASSAGIGAALDATSLNTHSGTLTTDAGALTTLIAAIHGANEALVVSTLGTLVADGASPTQAHVTAVNNAWATLKTAIDLVVNTAPAADAVLIAADTAILVAALNHDVVVNIDTTQVTTATQLKRAFDAVLQQVQASGILTP